VLETGWPEAIVVFITVFFNHEDVRDISRVIFTLDPYAMLWPGFSWNRMVSRWKPCS